MWILLGCAAAFPLVVQNSYYLYLVQVICVYTVACIGLNLLSGYAGLMSFGHGGLSAVGAYALAITVVDHGWPWPAAFSAAVVASAIAGLLLGIPSLRVRSYYLALVTLAFGILIEQWLIEWSGLTGGWNGIGGITHPGSAIRVGGADGFYYLILGVTGAGFWLSRNLVASRWGRRLVCLRDGEIVAGTMGIDTYRTKLTAFVLSAVYAGAGGALYAGLIGFVSPDSFRVDLSIFFFLSIVVGGLGTLAGPPIGVSLLFLVPQVLLAGFQNYRLLVYGALTIVIAIVLPEGITGAFRKRFGPTMRPVAEPGERAAPVPEPGREAPPGPGPVLRVVEVSKRFAGVRALAGVSFDVEPRQCCGIIGPNGSGKTTLLNVISGLYPPEEGQVWLDGRRIDRLPAHRIARMGLSRTFQTPRLFGDLTVDESIMVGVDGRARASLLECMLRLPRARREEARARERAAALSSFVGLGGRGAAVARTLPHGQQRLVELGRALASRPRLLLLDEPAAGLNADEIRHLGTLLDRIVGDGSSVVLIEHRMDLVVAAARMVMVLDGGRPVASGVTSQVVRDARVIEAYLGTVDSRELPLSEGSRARGG
jgi:ABC-type branched-subunit amino acid transport system ATPase component/ABC-type branched-subunit amino acid transport system permease subunit